MAILRKKNVDQRVQTSKAPKVEKWSASKAVEEKKATTKAASVNARKAFDNLFSK